MSLKNQYNFPEAKLGPGFAQDKLKEFKQLIEAALSFVVLSMPGVGVSYFLKYLTMQKFAYFIHIDLYSLPTLNQHEFYRMFLRDLKGNPDGKSDGQVFIETKEILKKLAAQHEKVVIIFSRFDQLKNDFDANFLSNLQALTTIQTGSPRSAPASTKVAGGAGKIVLIFTSTRPLHEIAPTALTGGNLNFYSEELYFKPYSKDDLKKLLRIEPSRPGLGSSAIEKLLDSSGGHNQLFRILLSSPKQNLLLDRFVKMQMKELIDYLDYHQRKQLQKVALGKSIEEIDDYLLGVGMIKKYQISNIKYQIFTPLLSEYIKTNLPVKLPVKEARLFRLLRAGIGRTVSKDEIFHEVWPNDSDSATDWALDALIYRLRKHPFMQANNYVIESQKKVGYTLVQT
ncbi:hypothetical protein A3J19_02525 [Candidatus Daviesbacteria bacterium RIFCSPLOWO2_02_FULL_41_8]|uniref:OmpR/PhoB-type domain-containing protein n=2 Tax=Candidatus Daviesiibacteriota TaxID=1752718 RepID=A0A1F5NGK6_9BACT|nr:MAG: hypothetical protein A2871_02175 [Candidatus Daviesbacteria bacterium RIFCSPHIGHO2_01_FULL_41_23]OGE76723.1 MAG: hypothetical protein A3J19_02525 [Candidatus Daviesbacteria bacterium RIFCSPLOWO2_02_FULL_41_8]